MAAIGIDPIISIIFMVLKLTNFIDWSWWWIFAPFWMPLSLGLFLKVVLKLLRE